MIAALGLGLLLFVLGFLPLLGGPRYEAALLCGLLAPGWALVAVSLAMRRRLFGLRQDAARDGLPRRLAGAALALDAATLAGQLSVVVLLVAVVHGLRVGPCEPLEGMALFLLGPIVGLFLASFVGGLLGVGSIFVLRQDNRFTRLIVAAAAVSLPLASALFELYAFYVSPVVYAYDEFAGYFAGPLYDATEFELARLLSFRVGTLGLCAACVGVLSAVAVSFDKDGERLHWLRTASSPDPRIRQALGLAGAGLLLFIVVASEGESLGHRGSAESIRQELGRTTARKRCRVHFSRHVPSAEATRIARECEGHLNQLGRYFAVEPPRQVDVYLFADDSEKRRLIGAGRTNVAKPWRHEVYIRPMGVPHAILGHELAHVVSAAFGQGPFQVAGVFGGLVPDPGRVEGFAEAAAVREASEGTLLEWASAMRKVEQLPPLSQLFRLSFFGASAARSYTAAGAFVEFLHQKKGPEALKDWYGGAGLGAAAGASLSELEAEFLQVLDATPVPDDVLAIAKPRFSRPGVFERRCPHAVDRLVSKAYGLCGVQPQKAKRLFSEVIALDPARVGVELVGPKCDWLGQQQELAEREYAKLLPEETRYSPEELRGAWEDLGDLRWNAGMRNEARSAYEKALSLTSRRDERRQLEAKLWGVKAGGLPERALRASLAPGLEQEFLPPVLLTQWHVTGPQKAYAAYLLSRIALFADRPQEAQMWANNYEPGELPVPSLVREAARTQLLIACGEAMRTGSRKTFEERYEVYLGLKLGAAERLEADRWKERCLDPDATK